MRSAPDRFTKVIELTVHVTGGFNSELRGSDIPEDVQGILFIMPSSGKAVQRQIEEYAGNAAPNVGGLATIAANGRGRGGFQNKKTPRTPVLLRTRSGNSFSASEATVLPIPPVDGSYRFRTTSGPTVYGLIP